MPKVTAFGCLGRKALGTKWRGVGTEGQEIPRAYGRKAMWPPRSRHPALTTEPLHLP